MNTRVSQPGQYCDDYPTCVETSCTLRIFHDEIRPEAIAEILGIEPTKSFRKGEAFGKKRKLVRKANGWFYETAERVVSRDFRCHLDDILTSLEGKIGAFRKLHEMNCQIDICSFWVGIGQGGPMIEPRQMTRLGELGIAVWWDIYFDCGDDADDL